MDMTLVQRGTRLSQWLDDAAQREAAARVGIDGPKYERLVAFARAAWLRDEKLLAASPKSFLQAFETAHRWGLWPDAEHAALVLYSNEVKLLPMYKGLLRLALKHPKIATIEAQVVHEGDEFDYAYGLEPALRHKPEIKKPRGPLLCVYALVVKTDGSKKFRILTREDVERAKKSSRSANNADSPWNKHTAAMWEKTALKNICKTIERSPSLELVLAEDPDDGWRADERTFDVAATSREAPLPTLTAPPPPARDELRAPPAREAVVIDMPRGEGAPPPQGAAPDPAPKRTRRKPPKGAESPSGEGGTASPAPGGPPPSPAPAPAGPISPTELARALATAKSVQLDAKAVLAALDHGAREPDALLSPACVGGITHGLSVLLGCAQRPMNEWAPVYESWRRVGADVPLDGRPARATVRHGVAVLAALNPLAPAAQSAGDVDVDKHLERVARHTAEPDGPELFQEEAPWTEGEA